MGCVYLYISIPMNKFLSIVSGKLQIKIEVRTMEVLVNVKFESCFGGSLANWHYLQNC